MKHMILKTMAAAFVVAGQMSATEVAQAKEYSFLPGYVYGFDGEKYVSVGKYEDLELESVIEVIPAVNYYSLNGVTCREYDNGGWLGRHQSPDGSASFYLVKWALVQSGAAHGQSFLPGYVYGFDGEKYVSVGKINELHVDYEGIDFKCPNGCNISVVHYDEICRECGALRDSRGIEKMGAFDCFDQPGAFYIIDGIYVKPAGSVDVAKQEMKSEEQA